MKVVSSAKIKSNVKEHLEKTFSDVEFAFFSNMKEARKALPDAQVLITYGEDLTIELIEEAKSLQWIMVISAGLEKMPFTVIKERGIIVTNARGIHQIPMAEYTIAMMLQVSRQTKQLIENEAKQIWDRRLPMAELNGKIIGILGAGAIGTKIAQYAKTFNMKTIGLNRSGKAVTNFDEMVNVQNIHLLLEQSDFIVSVLPSTPETIGFLNRDFFSQMKKTAVFINIGRGNTVVEEDLIAILEEKKISHAVLDVFVEEPLPNGHRFWEMDNVTITPHISGISPQYQERAFEIFEENLKVFQQKEKNYRNFIDLEKGY